MNKKSRQLLRHAIGWYYMVLSDIKRYAKNINVNSKQERQGRISNVNVKRPQMCSYLLLICNILITYCIP